MVNNGLGAPPALSHADHMMMLGLYAIGCICIMFFIVDIVHSYPRNYFC